VSSHHNPSHRDLRLLVASHACLGNNAPNRHHYAVCPYRLDDDDIAAIIVLFIGLSPFGKAGVRHMPPKRTYQANWPWLHSFSLSINISITLCHHAKTRELNIKRNSWTLAGHSDTWITQRLTAISRGLLIKQPSELHCELHFELHSTAKA